MFLISGIGIGLAETIHQKYACCLGGYLDPGGDKKQVDADGKERETASYHL